jgi:hypothetical protein
VCFALVKQVEPAGATKSSERLRIVVSAQADGLESGRVEIETEAK